MIDLDTKARTEVTLPYETKEEGQNIFGLFVNDILEADGKLILVTEVYGNYALNKGKTAFEKVPSEYYAIREDGIGGKTICVRMGDQHGDVMADNAYGYNHDRETVYSFMVIGDTAYCLTPLTSRDTETSNSILVDERELTVNDIKWHRKDRGIILVILLQKQQKRLYD